MPPPIVVPVLLVLLVAKNPTLGLIPMMAGFLVNQLATLLQIAYPDGWGVVQESATE